MIKAKNDQIKKKKHEIYKTNRNKIVDLWRVNRKCHYEKYFKKKKKIKALELSGKGFMILSILKK